MDIIVGIGAHTTVNITAGATCISGDLSALHHSLSQSHFLIDTHNPEALVNGLINSAGTATNLDDSH